MNNIEFTIPKHNSLDICIYVYTDVTYLNDKHISNSYHTHVTHIYHAHTYHIHTPCLLYILHSTIPITLLPYLPFIK